MWRQSKTSIVHLLDSNVSVDNIIIFDLLSCVNNVDGTAGVRTIAWSGPFYRTDRQNIEGIPVQKQQATTSKNVGIRIVKLGTLDFYRLKPQMILANLCYE